ncbi:MAG: glutamate--cysteine ligase [Gammaproteobacteria bacterium]|nr:glutamate--cysteine ligase [Gammaproteobacteria bacterium]NIR83667.1 glutamate--cysteine ligase [Gammaproteobacteria bacterium]NIR91642.1 glutamate--cysteine ligase [Gammaproteobacteria bacterium]NIU04829.1 glutamate--cysteine ligase [Gammaproteobacteria bacterium]NIV51815.1 glutamate--cysteine ligase [Gammaproteobacteria bacterium]
MGQEISTHFFDLQDFRIFGMRLREETAHLSQWFRDGRFADEEPMGGFEMEAWLIDEAGRPAPINKRFLERLDNPLVVTELAKFNVELNTPPQRLRGDALSAMQRELEATLASCRLAAGEFGARMAMIGILPTVTESDLSLANISDLQRYWALNEQVLRLRGGRPLVIDIAGRERLHLVHDDVMMEAAATSMQIHLQVSQGRAVRVHNAAQILAAPMVAACANSPYFCGKSLWDETRIPLFEQSVAVNATDDPEGGGPADRVYFGSGYLRHSLLECFQENLRHFEVLLPSTLDAPAATLSHLRLHNGTIWRWNRPLIGFGADGTPHLRLEHRVIPAGPSVVDSIANAALFYGLTESLSAMQPPPETSMPFEQARAAFYEAARHGLDARIPWLGGAEVAVQRLLLDELLPKAEEGLKTLGLDADDVRRYLGVIAARVQTGRNGARWQRTLVEDRGADVARMTAAYVEGQESGAPVHEWET